MEKVYKVVIRSSRGVLMSAMVWTSPMAVEYEPGEWVEGKYGPLFAFDNLEAAKGFMERGLYAREVWEALAEGIRPIQSVLSFNWIDDVDAVVKFWRGELGGVEAPSGSVVCDRIKLVKRVCSVDDWLVGA